MIFIVSIAPAAVTVPEAATPQQAASGHTAILYPSTHAHALSQMVWEAVFVECAMDFLSIYDHFIYIYIYIFFFFQRTKLLHCCRCDQ